MTKKPVSATLLGKATLQLLDVILEHRRAVHSALTKEGLAAAKARGKELGGIRPRQVWTAATAAAGRAERRRRANQRAADLAPVLERLDPDGSLSLNALARKLSAEGVPTPGDKATWTPTAVVRLRQRLGTSP